MTPRDWWIFWNVVNTMATLATGLIAVHRLSNAMYAALMDHKLPSVNMMRDRNVRAAREQLGISIFFFVMAISLLVVAAYWQEEVYWFIPGGTAFFAIGWALWTYREWNDSNRMKKISEQRERESGETTEVVGNGQQAAQPS